QLNTASISPVLFSLPYLLPSPIFFRLLSLILPLFVFLQRLVASRSSGAWRCGAGLWRVVHGSVGPRRAAEAAREAAAARGCGERPRRHARPRGAALPRRRRGAAATSAGRAHERLWR